MKHLIIICCFLCFQLSARDRIFISDKTVNPEEKEAILILPGFGSKIQGTKRIADYFFGKGYDVFIPSYISRSSIKNCVGRLDKFIIRYELKRYKKIHVFSYIIGSWTLNNWIRLNGRNNISTIIYDRSPLQERAPYALVKDIPFLIRLVSGKIMKEFANTKYPPMSDTSIKAGIIIESKATKLITKHKKTALSQGEISWDPNNLNQHYTDKFYTWLNHDEMYFRFDVCGSEIFYFIKNGVFSNNAKREPYTEDPFIKFKENK